jgi:hypothetical protein
LEVKEEILGDPLKVKVREANGDPLKVREADGDLEVRLVKVKVEVKVEVKEAEGDLEVGVSNVKMMISM